MTDLIQQVLEYVGKVPMVVVRLGKGLSESLQMHEKRLDRFSFTERHEHINNVPRRPALCLLEAQREGEKAHCYLGVVTRSARAVSTTDSRLMLEKMVQIGTDPMRGTVGALLKHQDKHIKSAWKEALQASKISALTPKLSVCLAELLAKNSEKCEDVEKVFSYLMDRCGAMPGAQQNALNLVLSAFDVKQHELEYQETRLLEDNVIAQDAAELPGFKAVAPDMNGRYIHTRTTADGDEQVVIYVANRNLLEKMVGVDLIYINDTVGNGNIVMVQYKMLDPDAKGKWVFRPDKRFKEQMQRMKIPAFPKEEEDYRLHSNPFFFKFIRRQSTEGTPATFVLSLDHLEQHLKSPHTKGERGGTRVTYESLRGLYLRHSDMVGLLRSGYIGTHRAETKVLAKIFALAAQGKGNKKILVGWKKMLSSSDEG